jgi:hypothetical protein
VLIILVFFQQNYFEIATGEKLYEMWFSPVKLRKQSKFREDFSEFLECAPKLRDIEENGSSTLFTELNSTHFQFFTLFFGMFLIVIAIIMLTQMVLFGPLVWWFALMYGSMLLVKSILYDFSRKGGDTIQFNKNSFRFRRIFIKKFQYLAANDTGSVKVRKWYRRLDFFDIFGICGLLVFLTIQQLEGWLIADTVVLMLDNLISTFLWIAIIIIVILYLCIPLDVIEIKTTTVTYRIPITLKVKRNNRFSQYLRNLQDFPKDVSINDMKKTFLIRMSAIILIIFGAMMYVAGYYLFIF